MELLTDASRLTETIFPRICYARARIMRTPARALCLSQLGNPHGSLCKTLRTGPEAAAHGTHLGCNRAALD
jgi:hypothetical protein